MKNRVILIVVGGMCSDALRLCGHPYVKVLLGTSAANVCSKSVSYGGTRYAHTALMYSTPKEYDWEVEKETRLFDVLYNAGKKCSAFFSGEEFVKIGEDEVVYRNFYSGENCDVKAATQLIEHVKKESPDFTFLYLGQTDAAGHKFGFMSEEYLKVVYNAFAEIEKIRNAFPLHKLIVMSDHGGHDFVHEGKYDSDITIPIILNRVCNFTEKLARAEIIDVAPTVCKMLGVGAPSVWKGESLI